MTKETILVVDDNRQLARFVAETILPSLGYKTWMVHSGKQALELLRSRTPALMLLDLEMPDISGLDLLRKLNENGQKIPTILVTAHGSEAVAADAFRLGVQDYLTKPVDAETLDAAINRALTETRLTREAAELTIRLQEQVAWLSALSRVGQSITSTLDLNDVLRRIVEAGIQLTQAEDGFLALLDSSSNKLFLRAAKSVDDIGKKSINIPVSDSLAGEAIRTLKPVRAVNKPGSPGVKVSTGFLVESVLHVPILSKDQPLGVLSVDNRTHRGEFTERDEQMLTSLADYAAVALENARLYQQACVEIEKRKSIAKALRESEERYILAVQGANDGLWDWDLKTNNLYLSTRWKSMLGYEDSELPNQPQEWFNRIHPEDIEKFKLDLSAHVRGLTPHFENEHRMQHKDGSYRWILSRGLAVRSKDGSAYRIAGSQTDITNRKTAEARLIQDALHDRLTGLPNRTLLLDRLKNAIERSKRRPQYLFAVLFMDLDHFKNVNDTLGHPVGDQLLIAIAEILKGNLRATDTVARLGGDEFVILLEDIKDNESAVTICEWIINRLASPIRLAEHEVFVSTSIGVVPSTSGYDRAEDMLRDADIAMYAAKAKGKATFEFFTPTMRERILKRMGLESDLRQAVESNQLLVFYQPIVNLHSGQLIGLEGLTRWQHPTRGLILPADYIPLAKETGLIIPIDRWAYQEACRQVSQWQNKYSFKTPIKLSLNLTSGLMTTTGLGTTLRKIIQKSGLKRNSLGFDIMEDTLMKYHESAESLLTELRDLGIEIHIDNFGSGYTSLIQLQQFSASVLKIDRALTQQMTGMNSNVEIVRTLISLASDLGMQAIAEGIETQEQLNLLKMMGCQYGQGYLFAAPMTAQAIEVLFDENTQDGECIPWKELVSKS